MPTIICSYCQYVGQGEDFEDRLADVLDHEEDCEENPDSGHESATHQF